MRATINLRPVDVHAMSIIARYMDRAGLLLGKPQAGETIRFAITLAARQIHENEAAERAIASGGDPGAGSDAPDPFCADDYLNDS